MATLELFRYFSSKAALQFEFVANLYAVVNRFLKRTQLSAKTDVKTVN